MKGEKEIVVKKCQFKLNDTFCSLNCVEILEQHGSHITFFLKRKDISLEIKLKKAFEQFVDYASKTIKNAKKFKKVTKIKFIYADFSDRKTPLPLHFLGFNQVQLEKLEQLVKVKRGFFLITGKPLTGKTTTVLSLVNRMVKKSGKEMKIFTAFKDRHNQIEGAVSVELFEEPYSKVIRKICFHKPDILVIDDIENAKTGFIIRKALKNDILVFAVHCSENETTSLVKLQSYGISRRLLDKNLNAVIFQDLNYFEGEISLLADLIIPDKNKNYEHFNNYMDVTIKGLNILKKKMPVIEAQENTKSEVK